MKPLTPKQQRFVDAYLIDLNASQAAIRAGYSKKTAGAIGYENLRKPEIAAAIAEKLAALGKRDDLTVESVRRLIQDRLFFDWKKIYDDKGNVRPVHLMDEATLRALDGIEEVEMQGAAKIGGDDGIDHIRMYTKKIKVADRTAMLNLAMRHLGMFSVENEQIGNAAAAAFAEFREIARGARVPVTGAPPTNHT